MRSLSVMALGVLGFSLTGCSDELLAPFPEQLAPYELYFDLATIQQRRDALFDQLPSDAFAVVTTNPVHQRNGSVDYEFRPASNFYYLTGFDEPHASAIMYRNSAGSGMAEMILFVETRSEEWERWVGESWGIEGAMSIFGADTAYETTMFESVIAEFVASGLYTTAYANLHVNPDVQNDFVSGGGDSFAIEDIDILVEDLRGVKSQIEINAIQSAVDVTVQAFLESMEVIEPGVTESAVDALFDYVFRVNGCPRAAFPTIVASGANINIIHWPAGTREMLDGELVMIDAGAEYGYYAADVTRTLPVSGTFTEAQATIYNIVLEAHRTVIEAAQPGVSFTELHLQARQIVLDGLLDAGVIEGSRDEIISSRRYRQYIPASLGHPVGLDVHDSWPSSSAPDLQLQANMVIAFEPHIYLAEDDISVATAYRGIAARIEDTVLITPSGAVIMSSDLPREIAEIEERMQ